MNTMARRTGADDTPRRPPPLPVRARPGRTRPRSPGQAGTGGGARWRCMMGFTARPARIDWVCETCGTALDSITDPETTGAVPLRRTAPRNLRAARGRLFNHSMVGDDS